MSGHSKWASLRHPKGTLPHEAGNPHERRAAATGAAWVPVRYEGYGPGGAAVVMEGCTDSRDRTVSQVRQILIRHDGRLGAPGAVSYLFNEVGLLIYRPGTSLEPLTRAALQAGAEDVVPHGDGSIEVLTDPIEFEAVLRVLRASGFLSLTAEITRRASISVVLCDEQASAMLRLLEALQDLDDIQNVYTNAEIPDEVLARI